MELILTRKTGTQVLVTCDERSSHTFDLLTLVPGNNGLSHPLDDPVAYGKAIYQALFPPEATARSTLNANPERILFVSTDDTIDAIPWEYAYGPDDFVVLEYHFVRGLPVNQRIESSTLDKGLHIVAVPSNPLSHELEPLNIDGEWIRLKEIIQELPYSITVERTRPPTLERIGLLIVNQQQRIVHFMGHGGQDEKAGAILCFEKNNGDLDAVTARDFMRQLRGNVFLVTLNACISAAPGETHLSNLAAALIQQKTPYALGMRFNIPDEDALAFSRTFYSYLARGSSIEEAVSRVRLILSRNRQRQWMIGVPVLYTSLSAPATGFVSKPGTPEIKEHQPPIETSALPRAEGAFQGRIDELIQLGDYLTGNNRPRLVTIHGSGGQGKTALAREAVERFTYAWPGGVWATTLENLPSREVFVNDLARFLGIATQEIHDPAEIERQVLRILNQKRTLIVLDNTETLIEAVRGNNAGITQLSQFIQQLAGPTLSLLVTSREHLGWSGEVALEIGGLSSEEGANLFRQSAPQRANEVEMALAEELSKKLKGHPLSLRLLGGAFNAGSVALQTFLEDNDTQLLRAENTYVGEEHRHRTLYACIDTSVRYLDAELRALLSKLWVFHAPFLPDTAVAIVDHQTEDIQQHLPAHDRLHVLWQRGLLTRETATTRDGTLLFYRLLPTMRPYIEKYLAQEGERDTLLARFGVVCAKLVNRLYYELDRSSAAVVIAQQSREDLERGIEYVAGIQQGYYLLHWGRVLLRVGDPLRGLKLFEHALEIAQGQDQILEGQVLHNIAAVYYNMRQPKKVLEFDEQALFIARKVGDRAGEAAVLSNIALMYEDRGERKQSIELLEQALQIMVEVKDRAGEAAILNNIGAMYLDLGQLQQALKWYEQALPIKREEQDRFGEAYVLQNMGTAYRDMGELERALELYEEALVIRREMGDRIGEATTLSFMGRAYKDLGQAEQALELLERALTIMREIGDRNGEYATLNEMVEIYQKLRQPQRVLALLQQALSMAREDEYRPMEARILSGMAEAYHDMGQTERTLQLCEQALPIVQEVKDRHNEIVIFNNLASAYYIMKQPERSLQLYRQVLPIAQELGDHNSEATALSNMAAMYVNIGQHREALKLYEQALSILQEVGNNVGEATTLTSMAFVLYRHLNCVQEAIMRTEQAIAVLVDANLTRTMGGETVDSLQQFLISIRTDTHSKSSVQLLPTAQAGIKKVRLQNEKASNRKIKAKKTRQRKNKHGRRT